MKLLAHRHQDTPRPNAVHSPVDHVVHRSGLRAQQVEGWLTCTFWCLCAKKQGASRKGLKTVTPPLPLPHLQSPQGTSESKLSFGLAIEQRWSSPSRITLAFLRYSSIMQRSRDTHRAFWLGGGVGSMCQERCFTEAHQKSRLPRPAMCGLEGLTGWLFAPQTCAIIELLIFEQ